MKEISELGDAVEKSIAEVVDEDVEKVKAEEEVTKTEKSLFGIVLSKLGIRKETK